MPKRNGSATASRAKTTNGSSSSSGWLQWPTRWVIAVVVPVLSIIALFFFVVSPGKRESRNPQAAAQLVTRGREALKEGSLSVAQGLFAAAVQADSHNAEALYRLGVARAAGGDPEAGSLLQSAAKLGSPEIARLAWYRLGVLQHGAAGDSHADKLVAEASWRSAIEVDPGFAVAHATLGAALDLRGASVEAVASLQRATALAPSFAEAHYNLGSALDKSGDTIGAEKSLHTVFAFEDGEDHAAARLLMGDLRQRAGSHVEAELQFLHALHSDPAGSHEALADLLDRVGDRNAEAQRHYREGVRLMPASAHLLYGLGLTRQKSQERAGLEEAVHFYHSALAIDPTHVAASERLGSALQGLSRDAEAQAIFSAGAAAGLYPTARYRPAARYRNAVNPIPWYNGSEHACLRRLKDELEMSADILLDEYLSWRLAAQSNARNMDEGLHSGNWSLFWVLPSSPDAKAAKARLCATQSPQACALLDANHVHAFEAHFSVLAPGAWIRPHAGPRDDRLTAHLTLQGQGSISVDGQNRSFEKGAVMFFDDAFEHEVSVPWEAGVPRVTFMMTFEHPERSSRCAP